MPAKKVTRSKTSQKKLDEIDFEARSILVEGGELLASKMRAKLASKAATRELEKSVTVSSPQKSEFGWTTRVGPTAKHAVFVIFGRRPGARMPPVSAIENWLSVKGMSIQIKDGMTLEKAIRSAAWAIAKAISMKGIPAFPFVQQAFAENRQVLLELMTTKMRAAISKLNKKR
jgi:hypothetical protein